MFRRLFKGLRRSKGAALVEYSMLVAGIALIGAAAVAEFGHKTGDLIGIAAAILPGAHTGDNGPIVSGHLIEAKMGTGNGAGGAGELTATNAIALDIQGIANGTGQDRLGNNLVGAGSNGDPGAKTNIGTTLVLEPR
jgi:hypothetical protein